MVRSGHMKIYEWKKGKICTLFIWKKEKKKKFFFSLSLVGRKKFCFERLFDWNMRSDSHYG